MGRFDDYSDQLRIIRSLLIVTSLQKKDDLKASAIIKSYTKHLDWDLKELLIDPEVWKYVISSRDYDPKTVFCHPTILLDHPITSLYYRGMSGLSIKSAKSYCGSVIENIEKGKKGRKINKDVALKIAQTYNYFICSIINNSYNWTIENGHRTIIASLGITIDGKMRNKIGDIAEEKIKTIIIEWVKNNNLTATADADMSEDQDEIPSHVELSGGISIHFGSEPDIAFYKDGRPIVVVEIKGGIDPAGALERYGAATKSFLRAVDQNKGGNPRCKNFYLAAAYTSELISRIQNDRLVEKFYNIIDLLESEEHREEFLKELFVYTLRL